MTNTAAMSSRRSDLILAVAAVCLLIGGVVAGVDSNRMRQLSTLATAVTGGQSDVSRYDTGDVQQISSDAAITTRLERRLANDPNLSELPINVTTRGGRVALRGTAPNPVFKARATLLAEVIPGVVSVDNNIIVLV